MSNDNEPTEKEAEDTMKFFDPDGSRRFLFPFETPRVFTSRVEDAGTPRDEAKDNQIIARSISNECVLKITRIPGFSDSLNKSIRESFINAASLEYPTN